MIASRQTPPAAFEDNCASRAQGVPARMLGLILATLFAVFVTTATLATADAQSPTNNPCLSGYHPHPLYVVCTHFPE